jgi:hypothetical protein
VKRSASILLLVLSLWPTPADAQRLSGDVRSLGFEASSATGRVVRAGQWFPIHVELTAEGADQVFQGELQCERADLDGDQVTYVEKPLVVTGGAGPRSAWLHAVTLDADPAEVVVVQDGGGIVLRLTPPNFEILDSDSQLVVDISNRPVTNLKLLETERGGNAVGELVHTGLYYRPVCVARLQSRSVPDRWYGLEAADVIVWDEPNPDELADFQLAALQEWVRRGGRLVLGLGQSWPAVQKSSLASILPLEGVEPPRQVSELPFFFRKLCPSDVTAFTAPISVATPRATRGWRTFRDRLPDGTALDLIVMDHVGSGMVVTVAASLRDLFRAADSLKLLAELLDLPVRGPDFRKAEQSAVTGVQGSVQLLGVKRPLYDGLVRPIEFVRESSLYVLAAFGFVASYIVVATFASWWWLKRRTATQLSWTVFSAMALAASVLSLGAVRLSAGFARLHAVSIVDMQADSDQARSTSLFGYRSPRRETLSFAAPGDGNYLRPLARGPRTELNYATPERYESATNKGELLNVPMRATLKQFEGTWSGSLNGTIRGQIAVDRATGQITPESWLQNDLEVEFFLGYVIFMDPRGADAMPLRAAGLNQPRRGRDQSFNTVPVAANILAVQLPPLRPGDRLSLIGREQYDRYHSARDDWSRKQNPDPRDEPELPTLWDFQNGQWITGVSSDVLAALGFNRVWGSALLHATRDLYLNTGTRFDAVGFPLTGEGVTDGDVSHWLMEGTAVLLLLAEDPGPAHLERVDGAGRRTAMEAREGFSIYRVRMPLQYARGRPN